MTSQAATSGRLSLVATPIGHLEDITLRALRILREADVIVAEDTRRTQKLLNHYQITVPATSYYKDNENRKTPDLLRQLQTGRKLALVTDAGMPGVSDPGLRLLRAAREAGVETEIIPGPSAVLTALVGAAFPSEAFSFYGFLPHRSGDRRRVLESLCQHTETLIFFVSPHRLADVLRDCRNVLGDRPAVLGREMTKVHEEFIPGLLSDLEHRLGQHPARGEYTLVITGGEPHRAQPDHESLEDQLRRLQAEGLTINQAVARVARERGMPRQAVYRAAHDPKVT